MPDTRKHILVEPDTHTAFMSFTVENNKTQDTGIAYLLKFHKMVKKQNPALYEKIKFALN